VAPHLGRDSLAGFKTLGCLDTAGCDSAAQPVKARTVSLPFALQVLEDNPASGVTASPRNRLWATASTPKPLLSKPLLYGYGSVVIDLSSPKGEMPSSGVRFRTAPSGGGQSPTFRHPLSSR
jgi:hypothetical protein